jgi:DNA-binding NarL/FixJ family response regulator
MPGLDGPQTARHILERRPETVVVLVSAHGEKLAEVAQSCGTAWVLPKSDVSPQSLTDIWADARARAARARGKARALREEAQALQAQADHQLRRSARNAAHRTPDNS